MRSTARSTSPGSSTARLVELIRWLPPGRPAEASRRCLSRRLEEARKGRRIQSGTRKMLRHGGRLIWSWLSLAARERLTWSAWPRPQAFPYGDYQSSKSTGAGSSLPLHHGGFYERIYLQPLARHGTRRLRGEKPHTGLDGRQPDRRDAARREREERELPLRRNHRAEFRDVRHGRRSTSFPRCRSSRPPAACVISPASIPAGRQATPASWWRRSSDDPPRELPGYDEAEWEITPPASTAA